MDREGEGEWKADPPDSIEEQKMIGFSHLGKRIG
jgi:hypothetical protein